MSEPEFAYSQPTANEAFWGISVFPGTKGEMPQPNVLKCVSAHHADASAFHEFFVMLG
jgi:hypothetical protein